MKKIEQSILAVVLVTLLVSCSVNSSSLSSPNQNETENTSIVSQRGTDYTPTQIFEDSYDTTTLHPVRVEDGFTYIDSSGILVNPLAVFDGADYFNYGYALVRMEMENHNSVYFYIDNQLNMAFGMTFKHANPFSEGRAAATGLNGKRYIISADGAIHECEPSIAFLYTECSENRLRFFDSETQLYGFLDENGQIVVAPAYRDVWPYSEGVAAVIREGYGPIEYIDLDGKIVLTTEYRLYEGSYTNPSFFNGLAAVEDGYINKEGNLVIATESEKARPFAGGRAFAQMGGTWRIIDTTGNIIATLDGVAPWYYTDLSEGVAFVVHIDDYTTTEGMALIDRDGNFVTDFIFDDIFGHPGEALYQGTYHVPRGGLIRVMSAEINGVYIDYEGNVVY